jgi:hypothetical protein
LKKLLTILLFLTAFISNAQNTLNNISGLGSTTASVAFSLRQLSTSYTGPLVRIYVGTSYYDVYPDASNKNFSLSSSISAAIVSYNAVVSAPSANALSSIITPGSTNATVAIWYDQSGNGVNVLTSSTTTGPKIISSGNIRLMNGKPTINFFGAQTSPTPSALISQSTVNYNTQQTATVNAVVQNVGSTSNISGIYSTGISGGWGLNYDQTNGYWLDGNGCNQAKSGAPSTTAKIVTGFMNKSNNSTSIYENSVQKGTRTISCQITNGTADKICIGLRAENGGDRKFDGNISEVILFPTLLSSADQGSLETNQNAAYFSPNVTITSSASGVVCAGTSVTFTAVASSISTPTYQWYKNGTAINGANSSTYSSTSLSNNDVIKVSAGDVIVTNSLIQNLDANNASSYTSGNTWTDLTGNGKNGTIVTGSSGTVAIATESNIKSFSFTKGLSYISAPVTKTASMSFNVWAKTSSLTNYNSPGTMLFNAGASGTGWLTGGPTLFIAGNKIFWNTYDGTTNPFKLNGTDITPTTASINDNNWHCFTVLVEEVVNTASIYIDGVFKGTAVYKSPNLYSTTALFIGGEGNNANITNYDLAWVGNISAFQSYSRALSLAEVVQNFNAKASFFGVTSSASTFSNSITATVTVIATPAITVTGDACVNKTSLTTPSGLTSYAWYKDNVIINGATSNTYTPSASGAYTVQVTSGSCSNTSTVTTIYTCGKTAEGRMVSIGSSTILVNSSGEINSNNGVDQRGLKLVAPTIPTGTNPVTNGLILYLDATRPASYSGSGPTWSDLSTQNNTATLTGNPTYNASPASFTFAANKYALTSTLINSISTATFIAWVNPSQIQVTYTGLIFSRSPNSGATNPATGLNFYNNNSIGYSWNDNPNTYNWDSGLQAAVGAWSMIAVTISSTSATAYLFNASNPTGLSRTNTVSHPSLTGLKFYIGSEPFDLNTRAFLGKMGTALVYSSTLTQTDIESIYNAQKIAFGL